MDVTIPACIPRDVSASVKAHLETRQALIADEKQTRSGQTPSNLIDSQPI